MNMPSFSGMAIWWILAAIVVLALILFVRNAFKGQGRSIREKGAIKARQVDDDTTPHQG